MWCKAVFISYYSSLQCHMILQKSFMLIINVGYNKNNCAAIYINLTSLLNKSICFFQKNKEKITDPKHLNGSVYIFRQITMHIYIYFYTNITNITFWSGCSQTQWNYYRSKQFFYVIMGQFFKEESLDEVIYSAMRKG